MGQQEMATGRCGVRMAGGLRFLLAVLCAVSVANIYYAQPLLERIGADLSMQTGEVGLVVALAQAGYLVGLVFLVPLGDLVNRRRLIAVQVAAAAIGTTMVAAAPTQAVLFAGIIVAGVFSTVVQVIVAYAAAVSAPAERGRTIGVITGGVVIGIILARTMSGLVADAAGWRTVYAGSAIVSIVLAVVALSLLPADGESRQRRPYLESITSVAALMSTSRLFRTRAVMALFLFASFGVLWSGMVLPLSGEPWRLSTTQIGLFGLAGLAGALGASRAGRWADRGWGQRVTGAALVILVVSWIFTAQAPFSLVGFTIGVVLLDFAVQAVHVSSQNLIVAEAPESSSRTIGSYMVFYSLGSGLGAITATVAYQSAGWSAVSLLGAAYAGLAFATWILGRRIPAAPAVAAFPFVKTSSQGSDRGIGKSLL